MLCDCITGLPIYEITTPANVADSDAALDILAYTHSFLPIKDVPSLAIKDMTSKPFTIPSRTCIKASALHLSISAMPKALTIFRLAIRFVKRVWRCTVTESFHQKTVHNRNFAVPTNVPAISTTAPVITNHSKKGKIQVAPNMSPFPMITGFPLTGIL